MQNRKKLKIVVNLTSVPNQFYTMLQRMEQNSNNPHNLTKPVFMRVSNKFAQYLETKWQHFVVIRRIKILFHNVYKETLLIFRSKKLNIGKVFFFLIFLFQSILLRGNHSIPEMVSWHVSGKYPVLDTYISIHHILPC